MRFSTKAIRLLKGSLNYFLKTTERVILDIIAKKYITLFDQHMGKVTAMVTTAVAPNQFFEKKCFIRQLNYPDLKLS